MLGRRREEVLSDDLSDLFVRSEVLLLHPGEYIDPVVKFLLKVLITPAVLFFDFLKDPTATVRMEGIIFF